MTVTCNWTGYSLVLGSSWKEQGVRLDDPRESLSTRDIPTGFYDSMKVTVYSRTLFLFFHVHSTSLGPFGTVSENVLEQLFY